MQLRAHDVISTISVKDGRLVLDEYFPCPVKALHRSGWGGQELYLFPELNMLVAMTGGSYEDSPSTNDIIANHILPAVDY